MPKKEAFIIPHGLQLEQTDKGITIENQGDIVLKGSLGMKIHRLISTDGEALRNRRCVTVLDVGFSRFLR